MARLNTSVRAYPPACQRNSLVYIVVRYLPTWELLPDNQAADASPSLVDRFHLFPAGSPQRDVGRADVTGVERPFGFVMADIEELRPKKGNEKDRWGRNKQAPLHARSPKERRGRCARHA